MHSPLVGQQRTCKIGTPKRSLGNRFKDFCLDKSVVVVAFAACVDLKHTFRGFFCFSIGASSQVNSGWWALWSLNFWVSFLFWLLSVYGTYIK